MKAGFGTQAISTVTTDADGLAEVHVASSKQERDNFWVIAAKGNETAIVTPASYAFSMSETSRWAAYVYTDRPVYRPGHTVHWKAVLRERVENHLELPKSQPIHVVVSDEQERSVFDKQMDISAMGTVAGDVVLPAAASLGYYTIRLGDADSGVNGEFRVEEYRKPEYQVRVTAAKPRVLQGDPMKVVIDSRYFFGEPVANAKVKYRVYHSPHYWWDEGDDDSDGGAARATIVAITGDDSVGYGADQESEQTGSWMRMAS